MALSLLLGFGKKKPPSESPNDNRTQAASDDDYVVIERKSKLVDSMYPNIGEEAALPYYVQPLPTLPGQAGLPTTSDHHSTNPLDDVPFKLSSTLSGGSCEWSRNDAAFFKSVMSSAVHHNETVYKYDFSHEKSIMRESNQGSVDVG